MSNHNIAGLLQASVIAQPKKVAIIDAGGQVTFEELWQRVQSKAAYFENRGIIAGDRLMVFVPMSIELYVNVLAVFYIGATAVFVDEWVSKERLELCCTLAQCKGYIAGWKLHLLSLVSKPLRKMELALYPSSTCNAFAKMYTAAAAHTALITFTTGSTGTPKAAKRAHGFLQAQFNALLPLLSPEKDEVDMPMLPIVLLLNLGIGRTSVIANCNFAKPATFQAEKIFAQLKQHKITRLTCSPHYANALCDYAMQKGITNKLEHVVLGGAPVFPALAQRLLLALTQKATIVYGSTEAEPIAHIDAAALVQQHSNVQNGLCVGYIDTSATVSIIEYSKEALDAKQLASMQVPAMHEGEIIVSGAHVLDAYWNNDEAFKQNKIIDQQGKLWHRTGDMGYVDNSNQLFLLGRCKQCFEYNGQQYYPFVIEEQLQQLHNVSSAAVMLVNSKLIVAVETTDKQNIDEQAHKIVNTTMCSIKYMQLPKDPRHNSKIDYDKLREGLELLY